MYVCVLAHRHNYNSAGVWRNFHLFIFFSFLFCFFGGFSLWAIFGWQAQYYLKHHILCTFCLTLAINYAALENLFIYMLTLASSLCQRKRFANHSAADFYFLSFTFWQKLSKLVKTFRKKQKRNWGKSCEFFEIMFHSVYYFLKFIIYIFFWLVILQIFCEKLGAPAWEGGRRNAKGGGGVVCVWKCHTRVKACVHNVHRFFLLFFIFISICTYRHI